MQIQTQQVKPGLSHPVSDSQGIFRQLLKAMSEPGSIHNINYACTAPDVMNQASYSIALTLLDQTTSVALTQKLQTADVISSILFHNSVEWIEDLSQADFIFCNEDECPQLSDLKTGSEAYPDQSATLIIQCESFSSGTSVELTGPGIQHHRNIQCSAFNTALVKNRKSMDELFPLGIDIIFTCFNEFFCLPRTTRIKTEVSSCM